MRIHLQSQKARKKGRKGSLALELMLITPILIALFVGMVEFSMILVSRQQLLAASREGARVAALGGDPQEVDLAVRKYLGHGRLQGAKVALTDEAGQPLQGGVAARSGQAVEVWVELPTAQAVPDLLRFLGYSIKDDVILARTVMRVE